MKKVLLSLCMVALGSSLAFAHCGVCGVGEAKEAAKGAVDTMKKGSTADSMEAKKAKMEKMLEGLDLSEKQQAKVDTLVEAKTKAIKAAKDEFYKGFKAVLTAEQLKIYEELHDHPEHGHDH